MVCVQAGLKKDIFCLTPVNILITKHFNEQIMEKKSTWTYCYHSFRHRIMSSIIYQHGVNYQAAELQFVVVNEYITYVFLSCSWRTSNTELVGIHWYV